MQIEHEVLILGGAHQVFAAITKSPALWWGVKTIENKDVMDLIFEPKVGGRFYARWGNIPGDREGTLIGFVTAIKDSEFITLQGPFGMSSRAVHNSVTITLHQEGRRCRVNVRHHAFGDLNDELHKQYSRDWEDLLGRLKAFIEKHRAEGIRHDPSMDSLNKL